jgi:hypothetical protein
MDQMQATRRKYPMVGGLADLLAAGTSPQRTQQMRGLMEFLQVPDIAQTLDRVSYGEPLTTGAGMTTKLRPEAENTLMAALGMIPAGRPAEAGAMALGRAGERMAERVVPQVMERGGLPAEMLGAMAQGTQSRVLAKKTPEEIAILQEQKKQRELQQAIQSNLERDQEKTRANKFIEDLPLMGVGADFSKNQLNAIAQYRMAGDKRGALAEGASQTVDLLKQKLKSMDAKIVSESQRGGGNSIYVDVNGKITRISDHYLPDTPERLSNKERGFAGKWDSEVITQDWTSKKMDDYINEIMGTGLSSNPDKTTANSLLQTLGR